jgi:hypothetical protein
MPADQQQHSSVVWLTIGDLAERRGDPDGAPTGAWLYQQLREHRLVVVQDGDSLRVPALMVTAGGETRPELQPLLHELRAAGIDGRTATTWLSSPSSLLSGEVPEQVARTDQARATRAAARFAAPNGA